MVAIDGTGIMGPAVHLLQHGTANQKGQALEQAVRTMFEAVPGIVLVESNIHDLNNAEEIDLVMAQNGDSPLYYLQHVFFVECKNWTKPVGASEVEWFIAKLRDHACTHGILVVASGVTGMENQGAAITRIARALTTGIHIIILSVEELSNINDSEQLSDLILGKYLKLKVGKPQI